MIYKQTDYTMNTETKYYKLEIFIPATHLKGLQKVLYEADAGHIGNYDGCLSYYPVTGCWHSLPESNPYIGKENEFSQETEIKVETRCAAQNLVKTVNAIKAFHPYEEPVINIIALIDL